MISPQKHVIYDRAGRQNRLCKHVYVGVTAGTVIKYILSDIFFLIITSHVGDDLVFKRQVMEKLSMVSWKHFIILM